MNNLKNLYPNFGFIVIAAMFVAGIIYSLETSKTHHKQTVEEYEDSMFMDSLVRATRMQDYLDSVRYDSIRYSLYYYRLNHLFLDIFGTHHIIFCFAYHEKTD